MELNLQIKPRPGDSLTASYNCPCGCNPRLNYAKGTPEALDGCCCGNEFAVGPAAGNHLHASHGFTLQIDRFQAPWGEPLEAAWKLGDSQGSDHDHGDDHADHHHRDAEAVEVALPAGAAVDPVCGMSVDISGAVAKDLHINHEGRDFYFCGKGCKLEFSDDPGRYLDPSYVPAM